jgi:hypothetical protein
MPPMKTTPPAKALKTERTHEENQERSAFPAVDNSYWTRADFSKEHISPPREEVIEAWRLE